MNVRIRWKCNDWGRWWNDWGRFWDAQNRPQSFHHRPCFFYGQSQKSSSNVFPNTLQISLQRLIVGL